MQRYRHPLDVQAAQPANSRPLDLYGLPALPPDEPVPQPAPWKRPATASPAHRRSLARSHIVWLGAAGCVVVATASAAVGVIAVETVAALLWRVWL